MTDAELIKHCAARSKLAHAKFTGFTIRRMSELARMAPPEMVADDELLHCAELMAMLVTRVRKIQAVPKGGLPIRSRTSYRGIDNDLRLVLALHPHHTHGGVKYRCEHDGAERYARLPDFKHWAIEVVQPDLTAV